MSLAPSPRGCDFCRADIPAVWCYPAVSFTMLVHRSGKIEVVSPEPSKVPPGVVHGHTSHGSWFACEACASLIEAGQRTAVMHRALAVHVTRPELRSELTKWVQKWHGGFWKYRHGERLSMAALDDCRHPLSEWSLLLANPSREPGRYCSVCGDLLERPAGVS